MKKLHLLLILLVVLSGCGHAASSSSSDGPTVCKTPIIYTFSGESADFVLTDGRVTINTGTACNEKETIEGGTLTAKDSSRFCDITALSASLYIVDKEERMTLLSHAHENASGDTVSASCHVGTASGSPTLFGTKLMSGDDLRDQFYCEITVTRTNGQEETFTRSSYVKESILKKKIAQPFDVGGLLNHTLTDHTFCSATANRAQLAAVLSRYDETFLNAQ